MKHYCTWARDPCRKKRWKFPSFGFIFRAPTYSQASGFFVLLRGSEWLLLVPFYFTLIIPTLIASSSRISFPRLHFHSLILLSLSLSLSAILQFTTYWLVWGSQYCWVCLVFSVLDIDIYMVPLEMDKSQVT